MYKDSEAQWMGNSRPLSRVWSLMPRCLIAVLFAVMLSGCVNRHAASVANVPKPAPDGYLDLQAGWRLRVIVPLNKSGAPASASGAIASAGDSIARTVTVFANREYGGYETQIYGVTRHRAGIKIRFESAAVTKDGQSFTDIEPAIDLFRLPKSARQVRLVFLRRASSADHNMAVLGARDLAEIDRLTSKLEKSPQACVSSESDYCSWIPAGIAVRAERLANPNADESDWIPAQ